MLVRVPVAAQIQSPIVLQIRTDAVEEKAFALASIYEWFAAERVEWRSPFEAGSQH